MIGFEDAQGVVASMEDCLFLERNTDLRPGGEKEASQGHLRYFCPFPKSLGTDYDPIHKQGSIRYIAHQLGPENDTTDNSLISDFQQKYSHFHDPAEHVSMAFPVENKAGILGIHSLGSRETTMLRLKLNNISNQSLGRNSRGGRALFVQFYYADDKEYEIPLHVITVRGDEGKILNIGQRHLATLRFSSHSSSMTIRCGLVRPLDFRQTSSCRKYLHCMLMVPLKSIPRSDWSSVVFLSQATNPNSSNARSQMLY
jgi:hypothetical protein